MRAGKVRESENALSREFDTILDQKQPTKISISVNLCYTFYPASCMKSEPSRIPIIRVIKDTGDEHSSLTLGCTSSTG